MSKSSSSTTSKTDWPRLKAMPEQDIRLTDEHPADEVDHIKAQGAGYQTRMNAVLRAFKEASG